MSSITSPQEQTVDECIQRTPQGCTGKRVWLCPWTQRNDAWLPTLRVSKYTDGLAASDQNSKDSQMVADNIRIKGIGGQVLAGGDRVYDLAEVTVTYSSRLSDNTTRERWGSSGQVLEVSGGRVWASDGAPVDVPINKVFPLATWEVIKFFVHLPMRRQGVLAHQGKVNRNAWNGFGAETLLFNGPEIDTYYDAGLGKIVDEVTFRFTFNPVGWNWQWRRPPTQDTETEPPRRSKPYPNQVLGYNPMPVPVPGSGTSTVMGGWDRIIPLLYAVDDFSTMFSGGW